MVQLSLLESSMNRLEDSKMLKLILSNNAEIGVNDGSTIFDLMVNPSDYANMWETLTEDGLKTVTLTSENGDFIDRLSDLAVDHELSTREKDVVDCHFYLPEKDETELENERLREQIVSLTAELSVHDGAIADMGAAISGLAEEGGME